MMARRMRENDTRSEGFGSSSIKNAVSYPIIWSSFELTEFTQRPRASMDFALASKSFEYNHATFSGSKICHATQKILPQELTSKMKTLTTNLTIIRVGFEPSG